MKFTAAAAATVMVLTLGTASAAGERAPNKGVGVRAALKYDDPKLDAFLKGVLKAMNLAYTVDSQPDGQWVRWVSRSTEEEQEIRNRVSQYAFILANCKSVRMRSPDAPSRSTVSC